MRKKRNITKGTLNIVAATATVLVSSMLIINAVDNFKKK